MSRQYINSSKALTAVSNGVTLRKYCSKERLGKLEFALVCETLKYEDIINYLVKTTNLIESNTDEISNMSMIKVMLYDFLFGDKKIQGGNSFYISSN
jgi:hypothetical protein